ncbi:MAG: phosphoglycerate kinase [Acidobacteriota bacterium]
MIEIRNVDLLELEECTVFYRVDYNVPLEDGVITDATRIQSTIPTLLMMRERGARIILASHLGRPKGTRLEKYSLRPVRARLSEIMNVEVDFASDCIGEETVAKASAVKPGGLLLLENLRFHPGEEANDAGFAAELRHLASFYVNDAFGASHRAHASIVALPELFPSRNVAGGLLLARELQFLQKLTNVSARPFVSLLGGAKIAGKIEPLEALVNRADSVLIGGGMANTFLVARGVRMGASLVDRDSLEVARRILGGSHYATIELPGDLVTADSTEMPGRVETVNVEEGVADGMMAVDIGPQTIERYSTILAGAQTIFWNGPMGVFEKESFAAGTSAVAQAVAHSNSMSIVGGGESVEAVNRSGVAERISHISTGGGASLEFISGISLPGVAVLEKAFHASGD